MKHVVPKDWKDKFALKVVLFLKTIADWFFKEKYGHRAIVIETVAAIPGMVGAGLLHFRCLRKIRDDQGWIKKLLWEADNERMHLMTFIKIAKPSRFERFLIIAIQIFFIIVYFTLYLCSSRVAHRFVGYLEEEAVRSYTHFLEVVEKDVTQNVPAPCIAIEYWKLQSNATLTDVIKAVREDEVNHREVNHLLADKILKKEDILALH